MLNPNSPLRKWTPEQDAQLTKLWSEGANCSEIAAEMNCGYSRSAVIGRVHRLKLPARPNAVRAERPEGRTHKGQANGPGIVRRAVGRERLAAASRHHAAGHEHFRPGALPPERDGGVDVTHLIGFADRRIHHQCAWIVGDPLGGAMCCGRPVKPGMEWCEAHHARVYPVRGN